MKKPGKTFMKKGIWVEFVQVRVRTNIAPSNAFGLVQMLQEIVLGRLTEFGLPNSVIQPSI